MTRQGDIPVVYRTPITPRDRDRILSGHARLHAVVRRRPAHIAFVLVPRGRKMWSTTWPARTIPLYLEPACR